MNSTVGNLAVPFLHHICCHKHARTTAKSLQLVARAGNWRLRALLARRLHGWPASKRPLSPDPNPNQSPMKFQLLTGLFLVVWMVLSPSDCHLSRGASDSTADGGSAVSSQPAFDSLPRSASSSRIRILRTGSPSGNSMHGRPSVHTAVWTKNSQTDRDWRHTRNGWRQIDLSDRPVTQYLNLPRPVPLVHPFRVTLLVLLSVLTAVAWSSDEWDWSRIVKNGDSGG